MKKIILSIVVIAGFLGFAFFYNKKSDTALVSTTSQNNVTANPTDTPASSAGSPAASNSSIYKDGEFTGDVKDAIYGKIQVKITIANGKITDVAFLQFPNDLENTKKVSAMSLPILKQETIAAQNAKIDNVTGATQTTDGFKETLQSALDKAQS